MNQRVQIKKQTIGLEIRSQVDVRNKRSWLPHGIPVRLSTYVMAFAVGGIAVAAMLPFATIIGAGGLWTSPSGDVARSLAGHLAFQGEAWRWPLLTTRMLLWPHEASVAMADSNPAFSLLAKTLSRSLGLGPINLLGFWLALCVLLQPVAAAYALRGAMHDRFEAALVAAVLALLSMAWLWRVGHLNLMGQFVILAAIGLVLRMLAGAVRFGWIKAAGLLAAGVLFHPYLFVMSAMVLAAVPAEATLAWRWRAIQQWCCWLLACAAPLVLFRLLSGDLGGGTTGFGFFSMNLLSPAWPQMSGVFGSGLHLLDATGGQGEGFNYLGAGVLFLLAAAGVALAASRQALRVPRGLLLSLLGLSVVALSNRIYAGHLLLLDLGDEPWEKLFAPVRASGRFFWPVGYALMIGAAVVVAKRLPRPAAVIVFAAAALLQFADTGPLRQRAADFLAGADAAPPNGMALPAGTTFVSVAPSSMCTASQQTLELSASLLLRAARAGWRLGGAFLARAPRGFSCDKERLDAIESPLATGEARVMTTAESIAAIRLPNLGLAARCIKTGTVVICSREHALPSGNAAPEAGALPRLDVEAGKLENIALRPLLSSGWLTDADGSIRSDGIYATLLFAVGGLHPGESVRAALSFEPVGGSAKRQQRILLRVGRRDATRVPMQKNELAASEVELTPDEAAAGVVRIAFDLAPDTEPNKTPQGVPVRLIGMDLMRVASRALPPEAAAPP